MINILERLTKTIQDRKRESPDNSYVAKLLHKGQDSILKKVAEEAAETIMASKDQNAEHLVKEVADLWFHSMILLSHHNKSAQDVLDELESREGLSGILEKANRNH